MGRKFFSHAWVLGKWGKRSRPQRWFPGQADTKDGLAGDMIIMGDVEIPKKELEEARRNPVKWLESNGWHWEEMPPSEQFLT